MEFSEYSDKAQETAVYPEEQGVEYLALGLNGEAGEVAKKIKKYIRDDNKEKLEEAKDELGDVLWYWSNLCKELGVEPGKVAQDNLDKLFDRKERDKLQGSGDDR